MSEASMTSAVPTNSSNQVLSEKPLRVGIVGGGPGGLFSAWHLGEKAGPSCDITIFEASERVGGKIITRSFPGVGIYEAGVAEIYDYSALGPDPLKDLITKELGLSVRSIGGGACVLQGKIIPSCHDLAQHFGPEVQRQVLNFKRKCEQLQANDIFYFSERNADNAHPWARKTADAVIKDEMTDPIARRYVHVMSHSDVAAPPHMTNGLTFLKNVLMDSDGYLDVISVDGGNGQIVERLAEELDAEIRLNSRVKTVEPMPDGTYRLEVIRDGVAEEFTFDFLIIAVPLTSLSVIEWRSSALQTALNAHVDHFDRPGHYLRATLLFKRPFWRDLIPGDWWMSDAFDGCCVYDEGARQDLGQWAALGFLITGNAALNLANIPDEMIEQMCLDSLPPDLEIGRELFVESRVQRWMASVNAMPGGYPVRDRTGNHRPLAETMPGLFLVGDYMFDATLNGVLDSADTATDLLISELLMKRGSLRNADETASSEAAEQIYARFFWPDMLKDVLTLIWGNGRNPRVLLAGAHATSLLPSLRAAGISCWSASPDRRTALKLPNAYKRYHTIRRLDDLPFDDGEFDVVIETDLCRLPKSRLPAALQELKRVTRKGIIAASANSDLSIDLLERNHLLAGVKTLMSRWEWADYFLAQGLKPALSEPSKLSVVGKRVGETAIGAGLWYEDLEALLYSIFVPDEMALANAQANFALTQQSHGRRVGTHTPSRVRKAAVTNATKN
jgi:monoamine oxidase